MAQLKDLSYKIKLSFQFWSVIIYSVCILIALIAGVFIGCRQQIKDPLIECMKATHSSGLFGNEAVVESKVLDSCQRYHREYLVKKFLYNPVLDKDKNVVGYKFKKNKKETPFKNAEILNYIESGRFSRQ